MILPQLARVYLPLLIKHTIIFAHLDPSRMFMLPKEAPNGPAFEKLPIPAQLLHMGRFYHLIEQYYLQHSSFGI